MAEWDTVFLYVCSVQLTAASTSARPNDQTARRWPTQRRQLSLPPPPFPPPRRWVASRRLRRPSRPNRRAGHRELFQVVGVVGRLSRRLQRLLEAAGGRRADRERGALRGGVEGCAGGGATGLRRRRGRGEGHKSMGSRRRGQGACLASSAFETERHASRACCPALSPASLSSARTEPTNPGSEACRAEPWVTAGNITARRLSLPLLLLFSMFAVFQCTHDRQYTTGSKPVG